VRNLSGRSASAAKEIKALIRDSVDKVEQGTELVDQSGKVLSEIVTAVKKVTDIVAEIAAASREQHSGIAQVNKAVGQMDEGIQQNAALVEQAAAASEAIAAQAQSLHKLISHFIVGSDAPAPELAPAEPRAVASVSLTERLGPDRPWTSAVERPSPEKGKKLAAVGHTQVANDEWEEM
jgi:methyl-accepting chemotaxis protein